VVVPAAWLTVAGVISGASFDATPAVLRRMEGARRGSVTHLAHTVAVRFENLWAAVALVWRGGPLVFGGTVLAYALWSAADQFGTRGLLWVLGGHEAAFWAGWLPLVLALVAAVFEPLRVALIATAFDTVIGRPDARMGTAAAESTASERDVEAGDAVGARHVEQERTLRVVGQQEHRDDPIGP
jgi:hypothetical protein